MDLNNLGSGKKYVDMVIKSGNLRRMGWSKKQQQEILDRLPNTKKNGK